MWTTKKELQTALKLSCVAKEENGYLHFCPTPQDPRHNIRWAGNGQMRAWCGLYETRFYFSGPLNSEIYVPYHAFAAAVRGLDGREVELMIEDGALWLFQGKDRVVLRAVPLSESAQKAMPVFDFSQAHACALNGYELCTTADILGQLSGIACKANDPQLIDCVTIHNSCVNNREALTISIENKRVAGFGHHNIGGWGGVGIWQIPANAARKIVHAQKLLKPAEMQINIGGEEVLFCTGRWQMSSKLTDKEMVNLSLLQPTAESVRVEMNTQMLKALLKKAKVFDFKICFEVFQGALCVRCGGQEWFLQGCAESGPINAAPEQEISFTLGIDDLLSVVAHVSTPAVEMVYGGAMWPVWLRAANMSYALMQAKKESETNERTENNP